MTQQIRPQDRAALTAIAIDGDKNSQSAVKWAVDNILTNSSICILLHVRTFDTNSFDLGVGSKGGLQPSGMETQRMFLPYRGFCARKGIDAKEVVLHDLNVPNTILDYINNNLIGNIVVGASNRSALTRKFRAADVPSSLHKSAPDFCSVFVISKGKIQSVRHSTKSVVSPLLPPPKLSPPAPIPSQRPFGSSDSAILSKSSSRGSSRSLGSDRSFERSSESSLTTSRDRIVIGSKPPSPRKSTDSLDLPFRMPVFQDSSSDLSDFSGPLSFQSNDLSSDNLEFSGTSGTASSRSSLSSFTQQDLEGEMRRLKLELRQTMEIYNSICKEAVTAKRRERHLHQLMTGESYMVEEAKLAEEASLAMVEIEKRKNRAALEAAQMAQWLTEIQVEKKKHEQMKAKRDVEVMDVFSKNNLKFRTYTIEDIEVSTDYFSSSLKIGEGGYGPVYKATLDHTPVAIKVLRPDLSQGRKQFQQEVEVLSSMRHPHMVLLVGACPEYGCLVYEYMDNGSLEDRLFRKNNTPTIPWTTRFKIAAEISTALLFLHQMKPEPLVHRDLKPANILLDRNYVSKISDVGLARIVPPSVADSITRYHMTAAAGTFCYIDPEYQQTGLLGVKSDIYSLGVMLLQIITAMPPMGLAHKIEASIERGTFAEILDPTVTDWPVEEAMSLAKLSLQCCELRKRDRPDLGTIILPELQRLRDLGTDYEASFKSSGSGPNSFAATD